MQYSFPGTLAMAFTMYAATAHAQTRGFIVRLGTDTVAIERLTRTDNTVRGAVVRHSPTTTVLRYALHFNADSSVASYEESIFKPDGTPAPPLAGGVEQTGMRMTFAHDTVTREWTQNGSPLVKRNAAPGITIPAIGGTSPYWQEIAVQAVRRRRANQFGFYSFAVGQEAPNMFNVRMVANDSAEFMLGQGFHRGYKLDARGQLVHGDATNTTIRLQMTPIRDADIDAIAHAWGAQEIAGHAMGVPSTRDTVSATVANTHVSIDYGRPAKRGRVIWGKLVPFDTVWRLGANNPTVITIDHDLALGTAVVPPGSYSLWLVPSRTQPYLFVNKQTSGWVGVPMHDAAQDLFKVPVRAHKGAPAGEERFRIAIQNGMLMMLWDDGGYDVSIGAPLNQRTQTAAQDARYPCRSVHTFDFWVGTFDAGPWNQPSAPSTGQLHNTREYEGCVIVERWTGANGSAGMSMGFFDENRQTWRMVWNSDSNGSNDFEGEYRDGAMRFSGWVLDSTGKRILASNVLQNVSPDTIRHIYSTSSDNGTTWVIHSDGRFVRRK